MRQHVLFRHKPSTCHPLEARLTAGDSVEAKPKLLRLPADQHLVKDAFYLL